MKILRALFLLSTFAQFAFSQTSTPMPVAAYVNAGSGWSPWTSGAGFGAIGVTPASVALFCQTSTTAQWTPCVPGANGTAAITGGTINGATIGGTTPAAGSFTTLAVGGISFSPAISSLITSATAGSGVTSVTCATASCTNLRGTYTVVGGTATTGTIFTLVWPTTTVAYACTATMNGGTGFLGIGNSVATATGMTITSGIAVTGLTVAVNYSCQP